MLVWFTANLANIIIIAVLLLVVSLLIRGMIRDKKAGKSSCGGSCDSCGLCAGGSCTGGNCGAIPPKPKKEAMK